MQQGKSEQTQRHVYNLMRQMFRDAIDKFRLLTFSPVHLDLKPKVPKKIAKHLNLSEVHRLLAHIEGKEYETAILTQLFLGLRVGELIALRWEDLDLVEGIATIKRAYSRKDSWATGQPVFKDRRKGGRHHSVRIPEQLLNRFRTLKVTARSEYVASTSFGAVLSYEYYLETLKRYCKEAGLPALGTHGLRHSTANIYRHFGASKDDMTALFDHSSRELTDRYDHYQDTNLDRVARRIRLVPESTTFRPRVPEDDERKVC